MNYFDYDKTSEKAEYYEILQDLMERWEYEIVEFKEAKGSYSEDKMGQYFSAISNEANLKQQQFGWCILGVSESKEKHPVGTSFKQGNPSLLEKFKYEIAKETTDGMTFLDIIELFPIYEGEKCRVLMFKIPAAVAGMPTEWKTRYYARSGESLVSLQQYKIDTIRNQEQQRILMTTFTANLAADIRENLRKICTVEELRRIEVIHLDAWVNHFLRESGFSAQIGYDDEIKPLWERAVLLANIDLPFDTSFYEEEWNRIVMAQEALTLEKYVKATRNGRGTRLDRKKRMKVWKVFENYQNLMKENQIRDINTAMYESSKLIQSAGNKPRYASIIIDEGQDFSDNAYRLIRSLAGEEHPNDIFIVGDSHQRIYRNHPILSRCGIHVRGRSSILKINYRTTEEIRKHAFALLSGISFDDLDEDVDLGDKCQSLTHGEKPIIKNFGNANDEFDFILCEVKKLKENGVSLTDICIVARTKKLVDDYIALFTKVGIRSYAIKRNKVDDRSFDGLRVATMHRVKGLEFKYVFVVAANNRIVPLSSAINTTDAVSEAETTTSEKCLLYVAMTRAQKGVYITSYGRPSGFLD